MASAVEGLPISGNHAADEVRSCDTTSLPVCLAAQQFIRLHAVAAVVFLLIGGLAAILLALTRWPAVHLLDAQWYYRLHISSTDLQHGFSLQPLNMNFQVLPGYDHVLMITPTSTGVFPIVCNEFCGIGHHTMTGRIIVE